MMICTIKFDKKKAAFAVVLLALIIIAVILLIGTGESSGQNSVKTNPPSGKIKSEKACVEYLKHYGWSVESPAVSEKTVIIPKQFNEVFENYNRLQQQQGFDLKSYCGTEVRQFTFRVSDSDISDHVFAVLYVCDGKVIAGDVHSTELDGYICGIIREQK